MSSDFVSGDERLFLPTYRHPAGPQMHLQPQQFERLIGVRQKVVLWNNSLRPWVADLSVPDRRGIYLWDPLLGTEGLQRAIDACMVLLALNKFGSKRTLRVGLRMLLEKFFGKQPAGIAFVIFESCRDLILQRGLENAGAVIVRQQPVSRQNPHYDEKSMSEQWRRPLRLSEGVEFAPNLLPLVAPDDRKLREVRFARSRFQRLIEDGRRPTFKAKWTYWTLGSEVDHDRDLREGRYVTQVRSLIDGRVNPGRFMSWGVLDPLSGLAQTLDLDIDPEREAVLSLRSAWLSLETLTAVDPRLDRWLYMAIHGRDYAADG